MSAKAKSGNKNGKKSKNGKSGELTPTRHDLHGARHLPGHMYTSRDIFDEEIEKIFMKDWLCVGRVEQFPKAGDYTAMRIAGEPVIVCKDKGGKLNAFSNVCRHRGVEVAPVGTGNAKEFSCPYHGWLYDLDGKLVGAPFNKEIETSFDFQNCRLNEVKLDTWEGYIFINFDADAVSLKKFLDDDGIDICAEACQPGKTMISDEYTFDLECNWKFVPENLMDIYHAKAIHGDSFAKRFTMEDFGFKIGPGGKYHASYESNTMAPDGLPLFERMPWMQDKGEYYAYTVYIRPTMNFFARPDMLQPWVCYPLDVNRTRITIWTQFPKENFKQPAFWERNKVYADFIRLVAAEDVDMMRSLQNGVGARKFEPGPTVHLEKAIHHNLNYYLDRMYGEEAGTGRSG